MPPVSRRLSTTMASIEQVLTAGQPVESSGQELLERQRVDSMKHLRRCSTTLGNATESANALNLPRLALVEPAETLAIRRKRRQTASPVGVGSPTTRTPMAGPSSLSIIPLTVSPPSSSSTRDHRSPRAMRLPSKYDDTVVELPPREELRSRKAIDHSPPFLQGSSALAKKPSLRRMAMNSSLNASKTQVLAMDAQEAVNQSAISAGDDASQLTNEISDAITGTPSSSQISPKQSGSTNTPLPTIVQSAKSQTLAATPHDSRKKTSVRVFTSGEGEASTDGSSTVEKKGAAAMPRQRRRLGKK